MVPRRFHFEIKEGEHDEHRQRDHLLHNLELVGGVGITAPTVGRHLQQVFKKSDPPAHENHEEQRLVLEFQMAIPRERHEDIRAGEQHKGQPAGLGEIVHGQAGGGGEIKLFVYMAKARALAAICRNLAILPVLKLPAMASFTHA